MKTVLGSVIVLLAVLLAWFLFERTSLSHDAVLGAPGSDGAKAKDLGEASALETQPGADVRRVEDGSTPEIESDSGINQHTLRVRSSVGLVLPFIEWQVDEFDWARIDLDHGRCEIGPMKLPCLVRAPGHLAASASKAGKEIVLEPDALLVLESSELRRCTSWIRPVDYSCGDAYSDQDWNEARMWPPRRSAIAWGWISDQRWALAVSSELAPNDVGKDGVESVLRWRDGRRADIHFIVKPGIRGTWVVPCDGNAVIADLDVHVVQPQSNEAGPVSLQLWRIKETEPHAHAERYEWGDAVIYGDDDYLQSAVAPAGADTARFDSVPIGSHLSLAGRDEKTSAYGRLVFVHDGTARTLELRSGFELKGRVVSAVTSTPVTTMDWSWQFREGKESVFGWHAEARAVTIPSDGSFSLRGPGQALIRQRLSLDPLDPPAHLLLRIEAPGFEAFEKLFDTGGAVHFDCGEITLIPRHCELALTPGHDLTLKALRWNELRISAAPEVTWTVRDVAAMPDGGLEVFLARSEKQPTLFDVSPGEPRAWPESPSERMLIHVLLENDDEPWAFERGTDGRYVAVPRLQFDGEVDCRVMPSEGKSWFLGWQWHELWDTCEQVPAYDLGKTVPVHFSFPAEGATLYWSASGNPPHAGNEPGGSIPMNSAPRKLVLQ